MLRHSLFQADLCGGPLESEEGQGTGQLWIRGVDGAVVDNVDVGADVGVGGAFVERPHAQLVAVAGVGLDPVDRCLSVVGEGV